MKNIDPLDPTAFPASASAAPPTGTGQLIQSGLTTSCGTLYFMNKSQVGLWVTFEDGSVGSIPAWWARPFMLKKKINQLWLNQAYQLANNPAGPPISLLFMEFYQQTEDASGLYSGPIGYQVAVGGGGLTAAQQVVNNDQPFEPVVSAGTTGIGARRLVTINNDGSGHLGSDSLINPPLNVNFDGGGNLYARGLTTGGTPVLANNIQESGGCGSFQVATGAGQIVGAWQPFRERMTNVPSSVTLTTTILTNGSGPAAQNITVDGFMIVWTASAAGQTRFLGTYTTVGN